MATSPWKVRLLALGLGLGLVAALEGALRVVYPADTAAVDLRVPDQEISAPGAMALTLSNVRPYVATPLPEGGEQLSTAPELAVRPGGTLQPQSWRNPKPSGTFRIFVVGGSEVYGLAVENEPAYAYPGQLQLLLQRAWPDRSFEVINVGIVGQTSREMLAMVELLVTWQPDLVIFSGGGKDGDLFFEQMLKVNPTLWEVREKTSSLATFRLLADLRKKSAPRPQAPPAPAPGAPPPRPEEGMQRLVGARWEAAGEPLFEWPGGEGKGTPHRTDPDFQALEELFRKRLERMVELTRGSGSLFMAALPVTCPDLPPAVSLHDPDLSPARTREYSALLEQARAAIAAGEGARAVEAAQEARELDPVHAEGAFILAKALGVAGRWEEGWDALDQSQALDLGTLQYPVGFRRVARELCAELGCLVSEVYPRVRQEAERTSYGKEFFFSPGHLTARGNELWARQVLMDLVPALTGRFGPPATDPTTLRGLIDFERFPVVMNSGPEGPPPPGPPNPGGDHHGP